MKRVKTGVLAAIVVAHMKKPTSTGKIKRKQYAPESRQEPLLLASYQ